MSDKLRNFDLTVEEIRLVKAIKELTESLENITFSDPNSPRSAFFRAEIESLEEKLEDVRDNTLIR